MAVRSALNAAAKAVPGIVHVEDGLGYASGAPEHYSAIAKAGIGLAGALQGGRFSYRNGVADLSGEAPDSATFDRVRSAMQQLPGGAKAGVVTMRPPPAKTYSFAAQRSGDRLALSGQSPSCGGAERVERGGEGRSGDRPCRGWAEATPAGAPEHYSAIAKAGIGLAGALQGGRFSYRDGAADLSGEAPDSVTFDRVRSAMQQLPGGAKAGVVTMRPPPAKTYSFAAQRSGDRLALSGQSPSVAVRSALNAAAKAVPGIVHVEDGLSYASGAPEHYSAIAKAGIGLAGALQGGRFSYRNGVADLSGEAPDSATFDRVRSAMQQLPGGGEGGRRDDEAAAGQDLFLCCAAQRRPAGAERSGAVCGGAERVERGGEGRSGDRPCRGWAELRQRRAGQLPGACRIWHQTRRAAEIRDFCPQGQCRQLAGRCAGFADLW